MTYSQFEESVEGSEPVEIYRFVLGTESFQYTTSEDQITVDTLVYEPQAGLKRNRIGYSRDERDTPMTVEVGGDNEFARKYISVVPGSRARLTLSRVQRADFPSPEVIKIFDGFVRGVAFTDQSLKAKITVTPAVSAASRPIPRFTYQGLCNHVLYDNGCKADSADTAFRFTGTVSAVSGNVITVPGATAFVDGFFTSGFVEAVSEFDARMVLEHVGDDLTLLLPFPFDAIGQSVIVLAGCDHSITTCDQKFFTSEDVNSNVINYGGFAFVPTKDIFRDGLV